MSRIATLATRWPYLALAAGIVVVDQVTKILAHAYLQGSSPVAVIPGWFNLSYSRNPGGLFGYFGSLPDPWRGVLLTLLPVVAVILIFLFLTRADADALTRFGLASILGGAVGNLIDRVFRGEVVDFLDAYVSSPALADWLVRTFGTAHWPTFNVADSCIVTGACLLILDMLRSGQPAHEAGGEAPAPPAQEREHG